MGVYHTTTTPHITGCRRGARKLPPKGPQPVLLGPPTHWLWEKKKKATLLLLSLIRSCNRKKDAAHHTPPHHLALAGGVRAMDCEATCISLALSLCEMSVSRPDWRQAGEAVLVNNTTFPVGYTWCKGETMVLSRRGHTQGQNVGQTL